MIQVSKPVIADDERKRVDDVLRSGMIASGAVVAEFEKNFAAYCGAAAGIATSNGTTALHAALLAAGIGPGDRILTTPFTFIASTNSIAFCGAQPVFADIDPATYNLDPEAARAVLRSTAGIKAILLVHLYGLPCDMDAFLSIKKEFGVLLIEDCAQAHGAEYRGRRVGGIGDIATFSFYATKNLTTGEGGMIVTNTPRYEAACRKLINHGRSGRYEHDLLGYNYRMTNIAAALGIGQLEKLDGRNRRRGEIAARYGRELAGVKGLGLPGVPEGMTHVWHQYTVRSRDRDGLQRHLESKGVGSFVVYPLPNCDQPLYRGKTLCGAVHGEGCPRAAKAGSEVLSIPVHPHLTDDEVSQVIAAVRSFG